MSKEGILCRVWNKKHEKFLHFNAIDGLPLPPNVFLDDYDDPELWSGKKGDLGNLLYEGDIVEVVEETISHGDVLIVGVVVFDGDWLVQFPNASIPLVSFDDPILIGNDHEHPELLDKVIRE